MMFLKVLWIHNFGESRKDLGPFVRLSHSAIETPLLKIEHFVFPLFTKSFFGYVRNLFYLRSRSRDFDIVHVQYGGLLMFLVSLLLRNQIKVVSLRGSDWYRYKLITENFLEYFKSYLSTSLTRLSLNQYNSVIVMSNHMEREVRAKLKRSGIYVIPDPINYDLFKSSIELKQSRKAAIDNGVLRLVITSLSMKNPVKRIDSIFKAIDLVRDRWHGRVEIIAPNAVSYNSMPSLIGGGHILLNFSTHEGWPNAVKEALAMGLSVVSSDVGDLSEFAEVHGAPIYIVDSIEDMAHCILSLAVTYLSSDVDYTYGLFGSDLHGKEMLKCYNDLGIN